MRTLHATAYLTERLPILVASFIVWLASVVRAFLKQENRARGPVVQAATHKVAGGPARRANNPVEEKSFTTHVETAAARDESTHYSGLLSSLGKPGQPKRAAISSSFLLWSHLGSFA